MNRILPKCFGIACLPLPSRLEEAKKIPELYETRKSAIRDGKMADPTRVEIAIRDPKKNHLQYYCISKMGISHSPPLLPPPNSLICYRLDHNKILLPLESARFASSTFLSPCFPFTTTNFFSATFPLHYANPMGGTCEGKARKWFSRQI